MYFLFTLLAPVGLGPKQGLMYLVSIFVSVRACMRVCAHSLISDTYGPILFVLGTKTTDDGVHMHLIFFRHQIQYGRLAAILVVKKPNVKNVLNHISDKQLPMLFKLGTQITNDSSHMHVIYFEIRSKIANRWPF